jgi:hypothetical protein
MQISIWNRALTQSDMAAVVDYYRLNGRPALVIHTHEHIYSLTFGPFSYFNLQLYCGSDDFVVASVRVWALASSFLCEHLALPRFQAACH